MASEEDSSVISNVIFFHATLAPIDGGRGMIMPHQYKRTTTSNEILFALGISLWICMAAEPMTFFVTHAPREQRTWWTLCNRLWILMTILKEITVSPIHVQTQEKRTMQELQYKFAVVQGLKWPLGLCWTWTLRFSRSLGRWWCSWPFQTWSLIID